MSLIAKVMVGNTRDEQTPKQDLGWWNSCVKVRQGKQIHCVQPVQLWEAGGPACDPGQKGWGGGAGRHPNQNELPEPQLGKGGGPGQQLGAKKWGQVWMPMGTHAPDPMCKPTPASPPDLENCWPTCWKVPSSHTQSSRSVSSSEIYVTFSKLLCINLCSFIFLCTYQTR